VLHRDPTLDRVLAEAVDTASREDGWAHMGAVGSNLSRLASDFDPRSWGSAKLSGLLEAHRDYEWSSGEVAMGSRRTRLSG
jgi:hypothetical protein